MKITFFGAAGGVTGSSYLVETESHTFLVDFGMFQGEEGEKNFQEPGFDASKLDFVFLTHAHLDHCGRLPILRNGGFKNQIFATNATIELTKVVLLDSAHLQEEGLLYGESRSLYNTKDVNRLLKQFRKAKFGKRLKFGDRLKVEFFPSGHILGAASIRFDIKENGDRKLVTFSGDLGSKGQTIVPEPARIPKSDFVLMESTYGDRNHRSRDESEAELWKAIKSTIEDGGKVVIPSFAIERTQELLELFDRWQRERDFDVPVFLDSPMGIHATIIYKSHFVEFSDITKRDYQEDKTLLRFPNLKVVSSHRESMKIWDQKRCIVIAGSGMMTGGRVLGHLTQALPDPKSSVIVVGFQAKGTLGREIVNGAKVVGINGIEYPVNAKIETINGFSAHADQTDLLNWLEKINNVKEVILTHGEEKSREELKKKIENKFLKKVVLPDYGETIEI